jgi:phosphoribosylglycinamide formyltransferase-1
MTNIAIFASGSGSNAENIFNYFKNNLYIRVMLILSNKSDAFVLERAKKLGVETIVFSKTDLENGNVLLLLKEKNINLIVLAGFLLKIPSSIINAFPNKIINIHPSLLPKFGGKGMYGSKVHEEVIANAEKESGITIHYVNEKYDEGGIIFQAKCSIDKNDTPETLANKIHILEYKHFPAVIDKVINAY